MIDRRLSAGVIPAVGIAISNKGKELRDEFAPAIAAAKAEVAEQLQKQVADAVRDFTTGALAPLRAELDEVKGRLAGAEARLAVHVEPRAQPLALPGRWMGNA